MALLLLLLLSLVALLHVFCYNAPLRGRQRGARLWVELDKDMSSEVQVLIDKFTNGKIETDKFASELFRKDAALTAEKNKIENEKEISAIVGVGLIGMVVGGLADGAFADGDAPYLPLVFPLLTGGGVYALLIKAGDNPASKFIKNNFGSLVISLRKSILALINKKIDDTKKAINKKTEDTIQAIVDAPTTLQNIITKNVADAITSAQDYIVNIPVNTQSTIIRSIDRTKQAAKQSVDGTIADIQALPGNIASSIQKKAEKVGNDITNAPNVVASIATSVVETKKKEIESVVTAKINEVKSVVPVISLPATTKINVPVAKVLAPVVKSPMPAAKAPSPAVKAPVPAAKPAATTVKSEGFFSFLDEKSDIAQTTPIVKAQSPAIATKAPVPAAKPAATTVKSEGFFSFLGKSSDAAEATLKSASKSAPSIDKSREVPVKTTQATKVETKKLEPVKTQPAIASETKKVASTAYSGSLYGSRLGKSPEVPAKTAETVKVEAKKVEPIFKVPVATKAAAPVVAKVSASVVAKVSAPVVAKAPVPIVAKAPAPVVAKAPAPVVAKAPVPIVAKAPAPVVAKATVPIVAKAPAPVVAKAPAAATSSFTATTSANSLLLSSAAVKVITSVNADKSAITKIDAALKEFNNKSLSTDSLFKTIVNNMGSKDDALAVLPYCIGSLPRGDAKTTLNNYYQQFV